MHASENNRQTIIGLQKSSFAGSRVSSVGKRAVQYTVWESWVRIPARENDLQEIITQDWVEYNPRLKKGQHERINPEIGLNIFDPMFGY